MPIKNIVVSVAGSANSLPTVKYAVYLAKLFSAKLIGIYVVDEKALGELLKSRIFLETEANDFEHDLEEQGRLFLERVKKMAESKGVNFSSLLLRGVVQNVVADEVKKINADLMVMGELKELMSRREVFYDVGERIFREVHCPVVVVKNIEAVEDLYREL